MTVLKARVLSTKTEHTENSVGEIENHDADSPVISTLRLQLASIAATLTAAIIFTLTEHDDHQHTMWCAFEVVMQMILVVVGTAFFRTRIRLFPDSSVLIPPILMAAAFSLLCEPIQRLFFDQGHSFEVLVMHCQCNLMLALSVCGFRLPFQRLAMLIAVFLTIFCCTISNARGLVPLTVLFSSASVLWLILSWWETVDCRLVSHEKRRPALRTMVGMVVTVLLLFSSLGFGNNTVTSALKGFMPSSGGSGSYDPYSRGGVNDGDALVAGNENIRSFAPLNDAPFLDSDKPSLYDVFNDQFDEPPKRIKDQQKAIALPAELLKHVHQKMAEAKQAGREFSLIRDERLADRRRIRDLDSPAVLYVAGTVPARFRLEVYEHFDGVTWYPVGEFDSLDSPLNAASMRTVDGRHWLEIPVAGRNLEVFGGATTHSLKIANLAGRTIPSPPHLAGVNIEHVDRDDMYQVSENAIVGLRRKSIPEMTPINLVSEYMIRERLASYTNVALSSPKTTITRALPATEGSDILKRLAQEWTAGMPRGWRQISAIEEHLREHYVLDRSAVAAPEVDDAVVEFLTKTRRGPEYLFAASAATLLRSLGYPARLVSGFYADPGNYDARKQHTAVFAQNAHFWCEVGFGMDTWVTVEASPGYEIAQPPPGLLGQLWNRIVDLATYALHNALPLSCVLLGLTFAVLNRRSLIDVMLTLRWKLTTKLTPQQRAIQLGTLVEQRLQLARLDRDSGTTLKRWVRRDDFSSIRREIFRVADIADRAMFGDGQFQLCDQQEMNRLATALSYRRLRRLRRQVRQNETQAV